MSDRFVNLNFFCCDAVIYYNKTWFSQGIQLGSIVLNEGRLLKNVNKMFPIVAKRKLVAVLLTPIKAGDDRLDVSRTIMSFYCGTTINNFTWSNETVNI